MVDLDDIFKLATPKYVYIRDAKLGILKYFFMFLIFVYVVLFEIIYSCSHLPPHVANGFGHITMQAPVENCKNHSCVNKYKPISQLQYCTVYSSTTTTTTTTNATTTTSAPKPATKVADDNLSDKQCTKEDGKCFIAADGKWKSADVAPYLSCINKCCQDFNSERIIQGITCQDLDKKHGVKCAKVMDEFGLEHIPKGTKMSDLCSAYCKECDAKNNKTDVGNSTDDRRLETNSTNSTLTNSSTNSTDMGLETEKKGSERGKRAKVGDFITEPMDCRYIDQDRLTMEETPNQIFIPMRYVSYEQEMDPKCYDPMMKGFNGHVPKKANAKYFQCKESWITKSTKEFFVADIGEFTLNMAHSFVAPDVGLAGTSSDYLGLMAACPHSHPKDVKTECKVTAIPHAEGSSHPNDIAPEDKAKLVSAAAMGVPSLSGTPDGLDQITFGDLLKLTPEAQERGWDHDISDRKLPKKFGHGHTSIRESGGMLMLTIGYDNTGTLRPGIPGVPDIPFIGEIKPITYTYRPYFVPTKRNKRLDVQMSSDSSEKRVVNVWYGVTIQMSFEGKIVKFEMAELLKAFTTGLVLLSTATSIVVALAIYVFKDAEKYTLQIYQFTEDMSDYKKLDTAKEPVTSFTGQLLAKARGSSATGELTLKEVTDILVDYEIRLNRADGRDPKLAFPTDDNDSKDEQVAKMRKDHKANEKAFFPEKSGGSSRSYSQVATAEGG